MPEGHKPYIGPEITGEVNAPELIASDLGKLAPQVLVACTVRLPDEKAPEKVTVTLVVPCPPVMLALAGAVHK